MKIDHVLAKADQHLRSSLSSDAAVDVRLAGKVLVNAPQIGDGVAEEDNAILSGCRRLEGGVGFAIACELAKIVGENGDAGGAVLVETREAGGRDSRLGR